MPDTVAEDPDANKHRDAPSMAPPWYVVQHRPNAEAIARRNLERQGVIVFAPFEVLTHRKAERLIEKRLALFPGYLFACFDPQAVRWGAVNSTYGVSRLVSFSNGRPSEVPTALIAELKARCDEAGKLLPQQSFDAGDHVIVRGGPFADFAGTVEKLAPEKRVWVLLDILGQKTRVAISRQDIRSA